MSRIGLILVILLTITVSTSFSATNPNVYVNGGYVFGENYDYPRISVGVNGSASISNSRYHRRI